MPSFSFWGYGDTDLSRGSGLFIPETGVATNHHFNPLDNESFFRFSRGIYTLELVAKIIGQERLISLWKIVLEMPAGAFDSTIARDTAVFFSWSPGEIRYVTSIEKRSGALRALSAPSEG